MCALSKKITTIVNAVRDMWASIAATVMRDTIISRTNATQLIVKLIILSATIKVIACMVDIWNLSVKIAFRLISASSVTNAVVDISSGPMIPSVMKPYARLTSIVVIMAHAILLTGNISACVRAVITVLSAMTARMDTRWLRIVAV